MYVPSANSSGSLHIFLGWVYAGATATEIGCPSSSSTLSGLPAGTFSTADVGCPIMVYGVDAGGTAAWATIASYISSTSVTVNAAMAGGPVQIVVYREIKFSQTSPFTVPYITDNSIQFDQSLTTRPTLNFTTLSVNGSFIPSVGQPVLMTCDGIGDIFGGSIDQVCPKTVPGQYPGNMCDVQCVSWEQILTRRLLITSGAFSQGTNTDTFTSNGTIGHGGTDFELSAFPLSVLSVKLNGVAQTFAQLGYVTGNPQWIWGTGAFGNSITVNNRPNPSSGDVLVVEYDSFSTASATTPVPQYANMTAGAIVQALGALLADEGLTVSALTGPTVDLISWTSQDTFDSALSALMTYLNNGSNNYWYYITPRLVLTFALQGQTVTAPWNLSTIDGSDGNALIQAQNTITREKYGNAAWVDVSSTNATFTQSEGYLGDGTTKSFNTIYPVGSVAPAITYYASSGATGVTQTVGNANVSTSGSQWYWTPGATSIAQDSTGTAMATGAYIVVVYQPAIAYSQLYVNTAAEVARAAVEGGTGEYDLYLSLSSTLPIVAGTNLAANVAMAYAALAQQVQVTSYRGGLMSGMGITLNLPDIGAVGSYVVDAVSMSVQDHMTVWTYTLADGYIIGDWKTAFKAGLSGAGGSSGAGVVGSGSGSGGLAYSLTVSGTLAIGSNLASAAYVIAAFTPTTIRADIVTPPTGASLVIALGYRVGGGSPVNIATITIPAGAYNGTAASTVQIPAGMLLEVDITACGTTIPGANLTVTVQ